MNWLLLVLSLPTATPRQRAWRALKAVGAAVLRGRPWVDRLVSAWLIRRHIDPNVRIVWLSDTKDCPPNVLGFDFDGAAFSHQAGQVTFETLLPSFALAVPALQRVAQVVHHLDVGGPEPDETGAPT